MGRSADRGGVSHPTLSDRQQPQQQQQHLQQWGPSPLAIQAFEMYRACVAAGQLARFTVEQRKEGEFYSLSSRPPLPAAAATPAAAAGGKRSGRKPNKKRVEKQRARRECRCSFGAAWQQLQQPQGNRSACEPQHQQQATASSNDMPQSTGPAVDSSLQMQPAQPTTTPAALTAAAVTPATRRETRSSKKRKLLLSPDNGTPPSTLATPGGIPQVDGADSEPGTPDGGLAPPYSDPPIPPPITEHFPRNPYKVLCHLCFENSHYLMYDQCEFCHYRLKFNYKKL